LIHHQKRKRRNNVSDQKIVLDLLNEVRQDIKEVKDIQSDHTTTLAVMEKDIGKNTKDLTEHIEGVQQARRRLDILEKPHMVRGYIFKVILGSGSLSGSTYGIYKLLELFWN